MKFWKLGRTRGKEVVGDEGGIISFVGAKDFCGDKKALWILRDDGCGLGQGDLRLKTSRAGTNMSKKSLYIARPLCVSGDACHENKNSV